MNSDRRRSPRIKILGKLHGRLVALDLPLTVLEISLGGLSFETDLEFPVGAVHEYRLTLGDGSNAALKGRVVRCVRDGTASSTAPRFLVGVQFVEEPSEGSVEDLLDGLD
jgi:hypothetical protein